MIAFTPETKALFKRINFHANDRLHVSLNEERTKYVLDMVQVTAYKGHENFLLAASKPARTTFISRIPERKELDAPAPHSQWEVAATDITSTIIQSVWPQHQVRFEHDALQMHQYLLGSFQIQIRNAERFAEWRANKTVPAHTYELAGGELVLSPHQQVPLCSMMESEAFALFMEQGCGKTPVVIAAACNLAKKIRAEHNRPLRMIISMPKNVRMNWEKEFAKFATRSHAVGVLRGGQIDRWKTIMETLARTDVDVQVIVCSYDSVVNTWGMIERIEWDVGVIDEAHHIKSPSTQRAKFHWKLRDVCARRWLLTGTPITNHHLDLYSQLEFLGKGWSGFMGWKNFKSFYGVWERSEDGRSALVAAQNMPFMKERLSRLSFIITKEEAMPDLPAKVYDIIEVELSAEQREVYNTLRDTLAAEIKRDMMDESKNKLVFVNSALTKLLRLAQVTSGFIGHSAVHDDDGNVIEPKSIDRFDPNPKLDALVEILKEKQPHDKTIIWACWVQDIKSIRARLELEGIKGVAYYGGTSDRDREEAERAFNYDDDCKWFLGNAAAGGTGLNLLGYPPGQGEDYATNANHVIYYSQNWSSHIRSQSEDRAHRRGTRENVRITDLCVPRTIDEEIRARVLEKRLNAASFADLKDILHNVLSGVLAN